MTYVWREEEYKLLPDWVQQARDLLEDWFNAMEQGTAETRLPDPSYSGEITPEVADKIIAGLDEEFDKELSWASTPSAGDYVGGPGFYRLAPPQRRALAQQLHKLLSDVSPPRGVDVSKDAA